jgi:hypothetical protein
MSSETLVLFSDPLRSISKVCYFLLDPKEKLDLCLLGVGDARAAHLACEIGLCIGRGDSMRTLIPGKCEIIHQNLIRVGFLLMSVT